MSSVPRESNSFEWSHILPWTIIFKALTPACSISVIALALFGVVAIPMGWIVSETVFINSKELLDNDPLLAEIAEINRSPYKGVFLASQNSQNKLQLLGTQLSGPRLVFEQTIKPFYAVFGGADTAREFLYFFFGSLWSIVVWSFIGLGITRISLLRLTRNERAGLDDAFEYALEKFGTCFAAVSMPIGLAFLLCVPAFLFGLLLGYDFTALLVGAFWFLVLAIAFCLGLLLLGLMVGWPLVVSSVAAEGQNAFDAITRAYAYTFQRPVHYFFYALVAIIFGGICWLIVFQFTESVIRLSYWSTAWGANRVSTERIDEIRGILPPAGDLQSISDITSQFQDPQIQDVPLPGPDEPIAGPPNLVLDGSDANLSPMLENHEDDPFQLKPTSQESVYLRNARKLIGFWTGFARTLAAAFMHGLFWCMASAIYLLLRRDVDEMEMDEIYLIDERRTYDLPPLKSDEDGIPEIQPLPMDNEDPPPNP